MIHPRATAIGLVAVLLWAVLALFTVGSAPTPPLLSTIILVGAAVETSSTTLFWVALPVTGGAAVAAHASFSKPG